MRAARSYRRPRGRSIRRFGSARPRACPAGHPRRWDGRRGCQAGRTAQQGENVLNDLADSAPGVFVISLAEDDASSPTAYTARIDELRLLLTGRTVYWVTAPGKDAYTKIVNSENTTEPASARAMPVLAVEPARFSAHRLPPVLAPSRRFTPTATTSAHRAQVARAARDTTRPGRKSDRACDGWAVYRGSLIPPATPPKRPRHRRPHDRWPHPRRACGAGAPPGSPPPSRPPRRRGPPS